MKNIKDYIKASEAYCYHHDGIRMAVVRAINVQYKILRDHGLDPDTFSYEYDGIWERDGYIIGSNIMGVSVSMVPMFDEDGCSNIFQCVTIPANCLVDDTYYDAVKDITSPILKDIIYNKKLVEANSKAQRKAHYEKLKLEFEEKS